MNQRDVNYQLSRLNTKIGEIRMNRAHVIKNTVCYTLCGTFFSGCVVQQPTNVNTVVLGIDVVLIGFYVAKLYICQRELCNLECEKKNLQKCLFPIFKK